MRSNQLSYPAIMFWNFVEIEGLEPSLTEPESVVLPLHHISIWLPFLILGLQRYECFVNFQNIFRFFANLADARLLCQLKCPIFWPIRVRLNQEMTDLRSIEL